jgi:DNA polymerase
LPVYDILNAGPLQRFVVMGDSGPFIVHNCVQAVALDIQAEALLRCEARGYPIVMHTHDEGVAEVPLGSGSVEEMATIMSERPAWAAWWPLRAAGWRHERYQKD